MQPINSTSNSAKENKCSLCFKDPIQEVATRCHHLFCKTCLETWKKEHATCPTCANPLDPARARIETILNHIKTGQTLQQAQDPSKDSTDEANEKARLLVFKTLIYFLFLQAVSPSRL